MRKYLLIFLLVAIVLVAGCTAPSSPGGGETGTQSEAEQVHTESPSETGIQETSTDTSPISDLDKIAKLVTYETFSKGGFRGVMVSVKDATWRSAFEDFTVVYPTQPWFYSHGNLFLFEELDSTFENYLEGSSYEKKYFVVKVPQSIDYAYSGFQSTIAVLDGNGRLHLLYYPPDNAEYWPNEDNPELIYIETPANDVSWDTKGKHLATGYDGYQNYAYYVVWDSKEVYVVVISGEDAEDVIVNGAKKPEPKKFTFDEAIENVVVGYNGLYVVTPSKVHVFKIDEGPEGLSETATIERNGAKVTFANGYRDAVALYDGQTLRVVMVEDGDKVDEWTFDAPGYEEIRVYVSSKSVSEFLAKKGRQLTAYSWELTGIEKVGTVTLPVEPVWFTGRVYSSDKEADIYY
ncbi:hypothetical protein [Thermococcus sp.]